MSPYRRGPNRALTALRYHEEDSARRIRSYASRLLAARDLDASLLEFIICTLKPRAQHELAKVIEQARDKEKEAGHLSLSADEMAQDLIRLIERRNSKITPDWLSHELLKGLGPGMPAEVAIPSGLQQLASMLTLDSSHVELVMFLYHYDSFDPLEHLAFSYDLHGFLKLAADATGLHHTAVLEALKPSGRLGCTGLIEKAMPNSSPPIKLHDDVATLIGGISSGELTERFFVRDSKPTLGIECTHVPPIAKDIILSMLNQLGPANILLYGIPGTGKTEFARSIVAASGQSAYQVKHPEDANEDHGGLKNRRVALMATTNSVAAGDGVLIVDEADTFLNTMFALVSSSKNTPDKGWLNTFLDNSEHKIIWITNEIRLIEESTMRRFSYSLHFPRPNSRRRYQLWQDLLKGHPMRKQVKDETVRQLSSKYAITTGGIACALGSLERVSDIESESTDALLTDLVSRHAKVIGAGAGNKMQPIPKAYDTGILNTDVDLPQVVLSVTKASESAPADTWGDADGLNLLLWGAPGTGKTAFAQHIAETTGRELLVKRSSDILSPFVGVAESNIAEAFEEASETGSILLLDEADSLLIDRRFARQSWETTQTNELLCQMECYPGMLICCTNLLDRLDHAVLRRFAWKVEFKELSLPARRRICERYFADIGDWEQEEGLSELRGLTPGDVKAVWQRMRTMGESFNRSSQVVAALAEELRYKTPTSGKMGF